MTNVFTVFHVRMHFCSIQRELCIKQAYGAPAIWHNKLCHHLKVVPGKELGNQCGLQSLRFLWLAGNYSDVPARVTAQHASVGKPIWTVHIYASVNARNRQPVNIDFHALVYGNIYVTT